jgi:hypothetical protein
MGRKRSNRCGDSRSQDPHEAVPDDQYGDDREHNPNGLGIGEGSQQFRKIRPGGVSFDAEFSTFIQELRLLEERRLPGESTLTLESRAVVVH